VTEESTRPSLRPVRRAVPWVVAAVLLGAVGVPVVGGAFGHLPSMPTVGVARPVASETVTVNMTDQPRFSPAYVSVPAGTNATFHLANHGALAHTFTLLAQPGVVLNRSWTPTQVNAYLAANGSLVNLTVGGGGTANATVEFNNSTGFDSFEFLSVVPYQFQAGMYGFVNITSTAPGMMGFDNTTDSLSFVPDVLVANAAHYPFNLDILLTNTGSLGHTFSMAAQSNYSLSPANFSTYFQAHPPLVSVTVPGGAGATVWANLTVPGPGVYMYICEVDNHFQNGMYGFLYVGIPPPPTPAAPSTAVIQGWILVGSGVLLGIGILLAAMTALMGRLPPSKGGSHH
jgi:uncharacterized cupredoxin-like copper-binding protein